MSQQGADYERGWSDALTTALERARPAVTVDDVCARLRQLQQWGVEVERPPVRVHCDECGGLVRADG